ncbi:MAG: diphthine--ammonia ligase [Sulfolobales archaeon]
MVEKALVLYSGGKDSHYALFKALNQGYSIEKLLIVLPSRIDSWLFHSINIKWCVLHSELLGLDYEVMHSSGVKDREVEELRKKLNELRDDGFKYLISGVTASNYQKTIVDRLCNALGIIHVTPLWNYDPRTLLYEEVRSLGFIITAIQAYGLGIEWLGNLINLDNIEMFVRTCLKYGINFVGEGGEFETYVVSSPLFNNKKVCVRSSKKVWYPNHWVGYLVIEDAEVC